MIRNLKLFFQKKLRNNFNIKTFEIQKILFKPFTVNFEKGSPYVKEITDDIYPKAPSDTVNKEIKNIYADLVKANELYSSNDLNSAYTKSNLVLNDALVIKDHILPIFVYNLLAKILFDKNEIKSAIEKCEQAETYYYNILKLKSEKYYLNDKRELEEIQSKKIDLKTNWNEIMDCIRNTLANLAFLLWEVEEFEKSNEKLLHLLDSFTLNKDLLYFKVLHTISLNYHNLNESDLAMSFCNKIISEQIQYISSNNNEFNSQFNLIVAKTHQQIASIHHSNNEEVNLILPHYKAAESILEKCRDMELYVYLNNFYCLAFFTHEAKDFISSIEYSEKLNKYLNQKNLLISDEVFDEKSLNELLLKNYNLLVQNYINIENLECLMIYLIEYLNLSMQIDYEAMYNQNMQESLSSNFRYLIYLYEKNFESIADKDKISSLMNKCLSQFLNWKLIPDEHFEIEFYEEKLDTILTFIYLKFQKYSFDSELVDLFEKIIKKISILSRSYKEEFKNLKFKIELILVNLEMIKVILKKNNNFREKLLSTLFENVDHKKDQNKFDWSTSEIKNEIKENIISEPHQNFLYLIKLVGDLLIVVDKNKNQVDVILPAVEKLIAFVKDVLKLQKFKNFLKNEEIKIIDELDEKYNYLKMKNNIMSFFKI